MQSRVLVVGTTSDYIEWMRQTDPARALFVTDNTVREQAREPRPDPEDEILADLNDFQQVQKKIINHLEKWAISLDGLTCFDCESLELAAWLAGRFSLPYPSLESIRQCRDKYTSKRLWQEHSVPCPKVQLVSSADDVSGFLDTIDGPCVIKPLSGSGSELVFHCSDEKDCRQWSTVMLGELAKRHSHRLYHKKTACFLAEEFIDGDEYSCDFIVTEEHVKIIRLTQKIKGKNKHFGTISGYILCNYPSQAFSSAALENILLKGTAALEITETVCMVDFLVKGNDIVLIEMTPRPGGDCIPHLLYRSGAGNMLSLTLDFAQQKSFAVSGKQETGQYVGLRFHAGREGVITRLDTARARDDDRVREVKLVRQVGHRVTLPPKDYDSWYIGYAIFEPTPGLALEHQFDDIWRKVDMEIT